MVHDTNISKHIDIVSTITELQICMTKGARSPVGAYELHI